MATLLRVACVVCVVCCLLPVTPGERGAYTSYVNVEKLYTLEDELIALTSLVLGQERALHGTEDVHGIYNISRMLENATALRREVMSLQTIKGYIAHPVNVYHMVKRLSRDWLAVVARLKESSFCDKVMRVKIENIADNLPSDQHVKLVTDAILRLQACYNVSVADVAAGNLGNLSAMHALSLDDAFEIARVAMETKRYQLAVDWLQYVISHFSSYVTSFNITNALNMLSAAYLKLANPKEALATIETLLQLDPGNQAAMRNAQYITTRLEEGRDEITAGQLQTKRTRAIQRLCGVKNTSSASKNVFCTYTASRDRRDMFDVSRIKTEVLSLRPLIAVYRDMTSSSQQKALVDLGYEHMKELMYKNHYQYPHGLEGLVVQDRTHWRWVAKVTASVAKIRLSHARPGPSHLLVKNVGMEGYRADHLDRSERFMLGTFIIFFSEPGLGGGNVVFPTAGAAVTPELGSVLFYEKKAHSQMTVCPVLAETEWFGVYSLQDQMHGRQCYSDPVIRPIR